MVRRILKVWLVVFASVGYFLPGLLTAKTPDDREQLQWVYTDMKAPEAWNIETGSRQVVVAVIDNGFDTFHPDLYENAWKNEKEILENNIDDDGNGYVDDVWGWNFHAEDMNHDGVIDENEEKGTNDPRPVVVGLSDEERVSEELHHGTMVAGLIGAVGNNGQGSAGVSWQVKLMNIKVVGNSGIGDIRHLDRAIRYAVDNGAHIINVSLVSDEKPGLFEAVKYAFSRGVAIIAAAGNEGVYLGSFPRYPVCIDVDEGEEWVLGVSAIDESHHIARFSNYGSSCVDITAPGVHVSSTLRYSPQYGLEKTYGGGWSGTSFAAPLVSGTAALLKSMHPEWGAKEIFRTLQTAVNKSPTQHEDEYRNLFGVGRVQADKAVQLARETMNRAHAFSHLLVVDETSGDMEERAESASPSLNRASPVRAGDGVAAVRYRDAILFATVLYEKPKKRGKKNQTGSSVVTVYSERWEKRASWRVPSRGLMTVAFGDVIGDDAPEVIIAPAHGSARVYELFALDGDSLGRRDIAAPHRGVALGLFWNTEGKKYDILAAYRTGKGETLHHFSGDGVLVRQVALNPFIQTAGAIGSGDIDGNGSPDYVVAAGKGEEPSIVVYDYVGDFMQQFFVYPPGLRAGLRMVVGDYNNDRKDDIVVAPMRGRGTARVWSGEAKKLAEWEVIGTGGKNIVATF